MVDLDKSLVLNNFIAYRMANFAKQISDSCSNIYEKEFGLTVPEWRILARLAENAHMNARDLGDIAFMDKSKVSRAVKQMDEKGLLEKEKDPKDNRATYLSLSPEGKKLYSQIVPKALDWENTVINTLSAAEYRDFVGTLEKLEKQLETMDLCSSNAE